MATTTHASGITKKTSAYFADPKRIMIQKGQDKRNTRFDFGKMEDDLGSMKTIGWNKHQPALVKRIKGNPDFDFELVDGERRLTYCLSILGKCSHLFEEGIPIVIADEKATDAELLVQMMVSNHGKPFTPAEEMMAIEKLKAHMTLKEISKATGRSMIHLEHVMAAINADDSVKDAIKEGSVPVAVARRIGMKAKGDNAKQKELITAAKEAKAKGGKAGQAAMRRVKEATEGIQRRKLKAGVHALVKQLGPQQIKDLEAKVSKDFATAFETVGGTSIEDLRTKISGDDLLVAVFLLGAAQAMQAVLGNKINLSV